jgi:heme/copper-type cytochrome/quinol oxidase subunit 4
LVPSLNAFSLFGSQKSQLRIAKAKNIEKYLLSFVLKIFLTLYIFMTNIENVGKNENHLPLVVIPSHSKVPIQCRRCSNSKATLPVT